MNRGFDLLADGRFGECNYLVPYIFMRKFLTHPVVLLILVVVVTSILLLGSKQVSGYSWFGLWTAKTNNNAQNNQYIQQHIDHSVVQDIISAHTVLATSNGVYAWELTPATSISSIPQYIAASQRILMVDIISYLENASDKQDALDSLIWQMTYYQNQWGEIQTQLLEKIQTRTLDFNECTSQKEDGDRNFYQWLRDGDATVMIAGIEASKKGGSCAAEARIDINAHTIMRNRVNDITATMTSVSSLLATNRSTILGNYPLFKDTYLEQLLALRNDLRAKSPGTP